MIDVFYEKIKNFNMMGSIVKSVKERNTQVNLYEYSYKGVSKLI